VKRVLLRGLVAFALLSAASCARQTEDTSSSTGEEISRNTLDGAYMKIYGGRPSYIVFRSKTAGTSEDNAFFAEFQWDDGSMIRTIGTFSYGRDNLGNLVTLTASADGGAVASDEAGGENAPASDAAPDAQAEAAAPPSLAASIEAMFGTFHFLKTGKHDTILVRDAREKTYQFKRIDSYCGAAGDLDCTSASQRLGDCASGWACGATHTCECRSQ
jgi:hypothetical protein